EELAVVKLTTGGKAKSIEKILSGEEILLIQELLKKIPVADNVYEYAVKLVSKTRSSSQFSEDISKKFISWGAGPRASQYLIIGAKAHAALRGKYSPDIEDVQAVAEPVLRHRIVKNYMAEAEGYTTERIIKELL
ncbi:MAG: AAA family ATPase, partial [Bacteroidia bacterium]